MLYIILWIKQLPFWPFVTNHSFIILYRVMGGDWNLSPLTAGWGADYTLDRSPIHHSVDAERKTTTHTHSHHFESPINLICMSPDWGGGQSSWMETSLNISVPPSDGNIYEMQKSQGSAVSGARWRSKPCSSLRRQTELLLNVFSAYFKSPLTYLSFTIFYVFLFLICRATRGVSAVKG